MKLPGGKKKWRNALKERHKCVESNHILVDSLIHILCSIHHICRYTRLFHCYLYDHNIVIRGTLHSSSSSIQQRDKSHYVFPMLRVPARNNTILKILKYLAVAKKVKCSRRRNEKWPLEAAFWLDFARTLFFSLKLLFIAGLSIHTHTLHSFIHCELWCMDKNLARPFSF